MIITCPNCEKKFKIDNSLIPEEGRDLQCGSCKHVWFYKTEDKNEAPLTLNENISQSKVEVNIESNNKNEEFSKEYDQKIKIKPDTNKEIPNEIPKNVRVSTNVGSKLFSYLIVFIISFVALIILLDTLKTLLIDIFPGLEIILFNLFETLKDIKLFIIDLF